MQQSSRVFFLFACLKACFRLSLSTRNKKKRTITSKKHAYRPETSYVLYYSLNVYVYGSVHKVRSRWRACPRRIVIITSLKNNHMLDEQLYTTGSCVLQTDRRHFSKDLLSLFFSRDFWYTIDGYTYAHFVMTGTSGTHDGNGCRLNIHIEHSL